MENPFTDEYFEKALQEAEMALKKRNLCWR
jgi:hypothetical protein